MHRGALGLVVVYLALGAMAYLRRDRARAPFSVDVQGSSVAAPGLVFPLRVSAYRPDDDSTVPVRVVAVDGLVLANPSACATPVVVDVGPAPAREGPFRVTLLVASEDGTQRSVEVPLRVAAVVKEARPGATPLPSEVPRGDALGVEVLPVAASVAPGLETTVWVRVTDRTGTPVSGAGVAYTASGMNPPTGDGETDIAGLTSFDIRATSLGPRIKVAATRGTDRGSASEAFVPLARGCSVSVDRMLQTPGEPTLRLGIQHRAASETVDCDLWLGDSWLVHWHRPPGSEPHVDLDLPTNGLYRFQCDTEGSDRPDGLYLLRSPQARHRALSTLLRDREGTSRTATWRRALPVIDEAAENALFATYATQPVPVATAVVVASTRGEDADALAHRTTRARERLALFFLSGVAALLNVTVVARTRSSTATLAVWTTLNAAALLAVLWLW